MVGRPQVVQTGATVAYTFFVMPHDPRETTPILRVPPPRVSLNASLNAARFTLVVGIAARGWKARL